MPIDPVKSMEFFEQEFCSKTNNSNKPSSANSDTFFTEDSCLDESCVSLVELIGETNSFLEVLSRNWKRNDEVLWELPIKVEGFINENLQEIDKTEEVVNNIRDFVYTVV